MRSRRQSEAYVGPLSPKVREQAAAARLKVDLHRGSNGDHVAMLSTEGVMGYLPLHRSQIADLRRALDVVEARCEVLDELPDPTYPLSPERVTF